MSLTPDQCSESVGFFAVGVCESVCSVCLTLVTVPEDSDGGARWRYSPPLRRWSASLWTQSPSPLTLFPLQVGFHRDKHNS